MLVKMETGASGGSGNENYYYESQTFSGATSFTVNSGLKDITKINVMVVTNANNDYTSAFEYLKSGNTIITHAYYTLSSGGGVNNDGTKHALTTGWLQQCPNVTAVNNTTGDITVKTPQAATWNAGKMYITVSNEAL